MTALAAEIRARNIFREALYLHYIDGISCGNEIDQWLRRHGGWFRDNQQIYDGDAPQDDDESVRSSFHPEIAVVEAESVMMTLYTTLWIGNARVERNHINRGEPAGCPIDNSQALKRELERDARNWLVDVMGLDPMAAEV
jgi:hypothetical protein